MRSLSCFIALLLISLSLQQPAAPPSLVIELFRHGARAPLHDTYAKDWPAYQLGQLTSVGMREHYLLGAALAMEYPDILGQPYNLSNIYLRSSVLPRSIDSAASQLYGVYQGHGPALGSNASSYPSERAFPPFNQQDLQQINANLNNSQAIPGGYIPIAPNTTSDEGGITLLEPTQVCFNLVNNMLENVLSDDAINFWNDLAPTRQALDNLNISINNPYDLGEFGDALVCDYYDGRPLPGNIDPSSDLYLNVTFARNWFFTQALWGSEEQRQLLSVPLFNYITTYFDSKASGNTTFEFMFLSTAETNLLDLLATLNIVTADCLMDNYQAQLAGQDMPHPNCNYTEFASNIILEFYTGNNQSSVVFKYNDVPIELCDGQVECSYDDFKNLISQSTNGDTPDKYQRDCLGRTLPELQDVLEQLGYAFQNVQNGGDVQQEIDNAVNSITGGNSTNSTNTTNAANATNSTNTTNANNATNANNPTNTTNATNPTNATNTNNATNATNPSSTTNATITVSATTTNNSNNQNLDDVINEIENEIAMDVENIIDNVGVGSNAINDIKNNATNAVNSHLNDIGLGN